MRKEIHTAAPATSPAAPSRAKIPAPTMAPTPMKAASRTERYLALGSAVVMSSPSRRWQAGLSPALSRCGKPPLAAPRSAALRRVPGIRPGSGEDVRARGARRNSGDVGEGADGRAMAGLGHEADGGLHLRTH